MSSVIEWIRRRPNAITASTLSRLNKIMGFHDANLMVAEVFPHGYEVVGVERRCCTPAGEPGHPSEVEVPARVKRTLSLLATHTHVCVKYHLSRSLVGRASVGYNM